MWHKDIRILIISLIYSYSYLEKNNFMHQEEAELFEYFLSILTDKKDIDISEYKTLFDKNNVQSAINLYTNNQANINNFIKKFTVNWSKTSILARSLLGSFVLEYYLIFNTLNTETNFDIEFNEARFVSNYLNYCQNYTDKTTTPTMHAVILKILAEKQDLLDLKISA